EHDEKRRQRDQGVERQGGGEPRHLVAPEAGERFLDPRDEPPHGPSVVAPSLSRVSERCVPAGANREPGRERVAWRGALSRRTPSAWGAAPCRRRTRRGRAGPPPGPPGRGRPSSAGTSGARPRPAPPA